jgi:U6 snRNA-associated Sm-like protein LSm1
MASSGDLYLPGAASLLEQLDTRVMIILSDGRHLVGLLRSFDQFLNLVLENTHERILLPGWSMLSSSPDINFFLPFSSGKYCDIPLGLYIVRGDNIVLLGQLDDELERAEMKLEMISPEELANYPDDGNEKLVWDFE